MDRYPLTILAVFAHPDDEIGVGSTLAYYSDAGIRTVLVCATRGEAATIFCEDCATRETLPQVRTRELECACQHLGIRELRWLDWPDGGIKDLPRADAVGQVVGLIREIRPHVILTHPENGLYPHPDHLAVWEIVREAFDAASDPDVYPERGPAWAPARLFTRALPQSFFQRAPGLAEFRVELNGQRLPFIGTPDDQIDVVMRLEPWVERRMAAWNCHRSQHNPRGFSATMPDGMRREMAANEHYILAAARVPLPEDARGDLLAGLADEAEPDAPSGGAPEVAQVLFRELAVHRALAELCQTYQERQSAVRDASVFRRLLANQHQLVYRLARALRVAGYPAGETVPEPGLLATGQGLEGTGDQLHFLQEALTASADRLRSAAGLLSPLEQGDLWRDLSALIEAQQGLVAGAGS
ncbi:MAG: PIG-L family deacetylase [Anaerolineae bacterium]|nr:PIG-L family deacetylase [Anaerolineae bacterium]